MYPSEYQENSTTFRVEYHLFYFGVRWPHATAICGFDSLYVVSYSGSEALPLLGPPPPFILVIHPLALNLATTGLRYD
jgi:hypothetical protein